jgi:hypothetical protein
MQDKRKSEMEREKTYVARTWFTPQKAELFVCFEAAV